VESFDTLADEVGALESRVADAIFDTVRAQLRSDGADEARSWSDDSPKSVGASRKQKCYCVARATTRSSR